MRREADIEQWKELYEIATRIKEKKPWEKFWDMDLIGIGDGREEETAFISILGRGGDCYGIVVYEGYEGLNDFMMLTMQSNLNLSTEYVMFNQKNLTCYWGNREELTEAQRKIVRELGYKYRGKNQWLYFLSYAPGYYPYQMDQDEVIRMTDYMKKLDRALELYEEKNIPVKFDKGNMFYVEFDGENQVRDVDEYPLPFTFFDYGRLEITDEELLDELREAPSCNVILEADVGALGAAVRDKKYDRPANPPVCVIAEAATGMILRFEMQEPEDDVIVSLAEEIIGFILHAGAPKEIRVSNILVEAGLEQICETCKIKLRRVKRLAAVDDFRREMGRRM